ncbi:MAG: hypothetical protein PSY14_05260 [bacterium]|nr:hypothetical protein [bacterium]
MSADTVLGIASFTSSYIEPGIIKLKDKLFKPSQKTLDKRVTGFTNSYLFGLKGSLKVIKDALAKGANPNAEMDRINSEWEKIGTEPVLNKAVRFGDKALVDVLVAAGADPTRPDSDGKTAIDLTQRRPSIKLVKDNSNVADLASPATGFNASAEKDGVKATIAPSPQPTTSGAKPGANCL